MFKYRAGQKASPPTPSVHTPWLKLLIGSGLHGWKGFVTVAASATTLLRGDQVRRSYKTSRVATWDMVYDAILICLETFLGMTICIRQGQLRLWLSQTGKALAWFACQRPFLMHRRHGIVSSRSQQGH